MQYPVMNMHWPELDCYSNSNKNCIEYVILWESSKASFNRRCKDIIFIEFMHS